MKKMKFNVFKKLNFNQLKFFCLMKRNDFTQKFKINSNKESNEVNFSYLSNHFNFLMSNKISNKVKIKYPIFMNQYNSNESDNTNDSSSLESASEDGNILNNRFIN